MKARCTLITLISVLASAVVLAEADFYVAPCGDDNNPGTIERPFQSLQKAKLAVRELKEKKSEDIKVYLREGHYEVPATIIFSLKDSGGAGQVITYAAYPGERPVLSGGVEVKNFKKISEAVPGLPAASHQNVVSADVTADFRALFDSQGILPRAKTKMFISKKGGGRDRLRTPSAVYKKWLNPEQLEIGVRPHHAWIVNILPVHSADHAQTTLHTSIQSSYLMNPLHYLPEVNNAWVENAIEELDEPGEWVIDKKAGKLYLWPRDRSKVYHSALHEVIRIEGEIDYQGSTDQPVKNLVFSGLTFMHGDRYQINKGDIGVQHDWDFIDKNNSLVRLRGAENCVVKNCHFLHSGSGAVRLDLHAMENSITGNHIEHIGGAGIVLCGYGPGTKDVNRKNRLHNNHIHNVGEILWHSPGILLSQSGENSITNNYVHHTNYTAIIISGVVLDFFKKGGRESSPSVRWHEIGGKPRKLSREQAEPYLHTHDNVIEHNEVSHAMQKLGDGNAIYVRGAGPGNIIRRNYIHDLITPMIMQCAVRTDGGQYGTIITENIIHRCTSQGMMIKLDNTFTNNIVADVLCPPRGYYLSLREGPLKSVIKNNIFYHRSGEIGQFIHALQRKNKDATEDARGRPIARIEDADVDYNLYYSRTNPEMATQTLRLNQAVKKDLHGIVADPLFKDPDNGDFTLQEGSPALKAGFIQIDQSRIGLIKTPPQ